MKSSESGYESMTCGEVEKLLEAFVDGELPGGVMRETARHLARCASCEAIAVRLEGVQETVRRAVLDVTGEPDTWAAWKAIAPRLESPPSWRERLGSLREGLGFNRFAAPVWIGSTVAAAIVIALLWGGEEEPSGGRISSNRSQGVQQLARQPRIDLLNLNAPGNVRVWNQPESGALVIWVDEQAADVEQFAQ